MKMVWIYIRAIGLVCSRRWKKAMTNKRNQMVLLGTFAVILVCVGSGHLMHTAVKVNDKTEQLMEQSKVKEPELQSLKEEDVALHMEPVGMETDVTAVAEIQNSEQKEESASENMDQSEDYIDVTDTEYWNTLAPIQSMASSVLQSDHGKSYDVEMLFDGNNDTTWQEGEEGDGIGTSLTFSFKEGSSICGMVIFNGNGTSEKKYYENNRIKELKIKIADHEQTYILEDQYGSQDILFGESIPTEEATITIESVYEGTKYNDTSISEICFYTVNM